MTDLWFGTSGPRDAKLVLVGESWGAEEERAQRPFVGLSGTDLDRILASAGLNRNDILTTNVVAARPQGNQTWRFFLPRDSYSGRRIGGLAPSDLARAEVSRLYAQLLASPRALVIAAGNYALWALSKCTGAEVIRESDGRAIPKELQTWGPNGIMKWRGSMWYIEWHPEFLHPGQRTEQIPLLPIIHPAAIQRQWSLRYPTIHDLRARVPKALAGDWRPLVAPKFLAPPGYDEARYVLDSWIEAAKHKPIHLACDIETSRPFLTCIGFAASSNFAISIPFVQPTPEGLRSYWNPPEEAQLVHRIRLLLRNPNVLVDGQNFLYDSQYIQHYLAITPHCDHDTMLAQNVLFPGTPKALEYLSSMYCDYHWYWKEDSKEWDTKMSLEQLLLYNCEDCVRTWEIGQAQRRLINVMAFEEQMRLKMQTHHLCLRMMNRGIAIDRSRRGTLTKELNEAMSKLYLELLQIVPQEMVGPVGKRSKDKSPIYWFTSDKQTKRLFYEVLGFKMVRHPKTGAPTTGKQALGQFKKWYPEFTGLLNRLDTAGSVENTLQVLRTPLESDNRMRCSYNPAGTETHRLSSSENAFGRGTNLQNLTKGEEDD